MLILWNMLWFDLVKNLSIFVKQLLSENQDYGLIYKNVMDLINQMHINKMFTKKLI